MRIRRLLPAAAGAILLAAVVLTAALWIALPVLTPIVAAPWLQARGIDLIDLDITRPDWRGITVAHLELTVPAAGLDLRGDDIRITWAPLPHGFRTALASVIVARLALTFDPPPTQAVVGQATPSASALDWPTALLAALPARRLEITTLTASGRIADQVLEGEGSLRAGPEDADFSGVMHADALPAPVSIHARLDRNRRIGLKVAAAHPLLIFEGSLQQTAHGPGFTGTATVDLDRIQPWLEAPAPWPSGSLDLQLSFTPGPVPALTLEPGSGGRVRVEDEDLIATFVTDLTQPLRLTFAEDILTFDAGTLPVQLEARRGTMALTGAFVIADFGINAQLDASGRVRGTGEASSLQGRGSFEVQLPLRAGAGPARLEVGANAELLVEQLTHGDLRLGSIRARSTAPFAVSAEGLLQGAELDLTIDDPARLELTASVSVTPAADVAVALGEASLPLLDNELLRGLLATLPGTLLPANLAPRSGRIAIAGAIQRSAAGDFEAALQTRWRNAGLDFAGVRIRGASGAANLRYAGDHLHIDAANTTVDRVEWTGTGGAASTILMQDLDGSASGMLDLGIKVPLLDGALAVRRIARGDVAAHGVEIDASLSGDGQQRRVAGRLHMAQAAVGVPVNDVVCGFETEDFEAWRLADCSAAILGGEVNMPRGEFDLTAGSGYLPLALTGWQLGAVLGLMQDPALDGTGILDGSLPLRLQAMTPVVEQGWLAVRPPGGVLAYVAPAHMLAGIEQPALRLTLRAVRDLRYQRLESRVDYAEDGTLTLAVNLLGSNPDIEGGRPIQLNLNVTQNLLQLLQSLRLSEDIERELQRRMQRVQP